jgi:hypothetical protein
MAVISLESNPNCFLNILSCIQDLGIVIWCDEENTYISSYTAFGDLYEGPLPTNPIEPIELIPCALLNTEDDNIITAENENGILTEGLCDGQSTTTSTTIACKSPLTYLIEQVNEYIENNNNATICQAFENILNTYGATGEVLTIPKTDNYCCPDCTNVYFLGSLERFASVWSAITLRAPFDNTCCFNSFMEIERYLILNEIIPQEKKTCCNGFSQCIDQMLNHHFLDKCDDCDYVFGDIPGNLDEIMVQGIVEYNTIGGKSLFCELVNTYINNH